MRIAITDQEAKKRVKNFDEVCLGYTEEEAVAEVARIVDLGFEAAVVSNANREGA